MRLFLSQSGIMAGLCKTSSATPCWRSGRRHSQMRRSGIRPALQRSILPVLWNGSSNRPVLQLPTRIGLHAGPMLLGNIGAIDHYEYRAVGDIVNTASRMDGLNKFLGTQILVSAEVLQQLDGFLTRELGTFLLAGKSKPLVVHELLCPLGESTPQQRSLCSLFAEALGAYRAQAWDRPSSNFPSSTRLPGGWTGALLCQVMRAVQAIRPGKRGMGWSHGEK